MHSNLRYPYPAVFTVDAAGVFPHQYQGAGSESPPVPCWTLPLARDQARKRGCAVNNFVGWILVMVLLIVFAALGLGVYQIRRLQTDLLQLKEEIRTQTESSTPQRLVWHQEDDIKEHKPAPAAHLIGQEQKSESKTLKWESRYGRAFTDGIRYRDGGLQVNETGLYFVYSRVEFLSKDCKLRDSLAHTVYVKRGERLVVLMKDHLEGFCQVGNRETWTAGSNLGSMHQLRQHDWVFVNVSQPNRLSHDHLSNYFGLFRLP